MTSANATRLAVMITMFSLSVSNSIPAPRAGDIIREAANPEIDDEWAIYLRYKESLKNFFWTNLMIIDLLWSWIRN